MFSATLRGSLQEVRNLLLHRDIRCFARYPTPVFVYTTGNVYVLDKGTPCYRYAAQRDVSNQYSSTRLETELCDIAQTPVDVPCHKHIPLSQPML